AHNGSTLALPEWAPYHEAFESRFPGSSGFDKARGRRAAGRLECEMDLDSGERGQATARFAPATSVSWLERIQADGWRRVAEVNRELWLLLSLFALAALLNSLLDSHRMLLGLYTLPTLLSAYVYGRRHATLTALGSVLIVVLLTYFNPALFGHRVGALPLSEKWFEITIWVG